MKQRPRLENLTRIRRGEQLAHKDKEVAERARRLPKLLDVVDAGLASRRVDVRMPHVRFKVDLQSRSCSTRAAKRIQSGEARGRGGSPTALAGVPPDGESRELIEICEHAALARAHSRSRAP